MSTQEENRIRVLKGLTKIPLISTGQPSTLGTYRRIAQFISTEAVAFIDTKIASAPNGENEVVITEETQMLYLLVNMGRKNDHLK